MPSNQAAWLTAAKRNPLEVKSAPYPSPQENQIVIKNGAVAINPADWFKQDLGDLLFSWIKYPFILGSDVAGEVVEVGRGVTRFKVGDRAVGHAVGVDQKSNSSAEGGFQLYTLLRTHMASPIPSTVSYESACVIPLGLSTAACGLFEKDQLALQYPTVPPKLTGKTLLIWGGATSVGSCGIQLAVAAGYEVFTTASPKNFDYVKKLGASMVLDYKSETVIEDLARAFKGKIVAGALSIGQGSADACRDVIDKCQGDRFISMASYPSVVPAPKHFVFLQMAFGYVSWNVNHSIKCYVKHIRSKFIFGTTLAFNEVGKAVYEDFLPKALAQGTFICAPEPQVVGRGLESIQAALNTQKKGVSARKIVVTL